MAASLFALALLAGNPTLASARGVKVKITVPHKNATVTPTFNVKVRVRSPRARYRIRIYIDGREVVVARSGKTRRTSHYAILRNVTPGRHRVRALVTTKSRRASSSVRVNTLAPGESGLNLPAVPESFKLVFHEDFSLPAARGTMGSNSDANKVIYTGGNGTRWVTYPRTFVDTYDKRPYRSDQVLSVHDGYLDYYLHNVDGRPAGANPSPLISGNSQYQTYGRFAARMKVDDADLSGYHMAWLLWPQNHNDWARAESDIPEGTLERQSKGIYAFHHFRSGDPEWFHAPQFNLREWHTYTQDWTPNLRRYWVDDTLIGTTTNPVYGGPARWQLQVETKGSGGSSGHVLVDWVAVYSLSR